MRKKIVLAAMVVLLVIAGVVTAVFLIKKFTIEEKGGASDANDSLTSQADWEAGATSAALDTTSLPGSMTIDTSEGEMSLAGKTVSADIYNIKSGNVVDSDEFTGWAFADSEGNGHWWKIDLGSVESSISKISIYAAGDAAVEYQLQYSEDDISYTTWGNLSHGTLVWQDNPIVPTIDARYLKIVINFSGMPGEVSGLNEIKLYQAVLFATHTTAPTQVDGQEGDENKTLIEWTSFEATDNTPENTSITYEFRVSNDAENWTEWTSNFASLENRRYLQIRATLTSNDGVSTPQIDDYTINFHNNQKPNKPTAQTVIVGN